MYCKNCGKIIDDDSKFCNFCGAEHRIIKQQETVTEQQNIGVKRESRLEVNTTVSNPHKKGSSSNVLLYVFLCLIAVLLIYFFIFENKGIQKHKRYDTESNMHGENVSINEPNISINVDWNIGPLAGISWDMQMEEFSKIMKNYYDESTYSKPFPFHADAKSDILLLNRASTVSMNLPMGYIFQFYNVSIRSEGFQFIAQMNDNSYEILLSREPTDVKGIIEREESRIKFVSAFENNANLTSVYLFPDEDATEVINKLSNGLGDNPVNKSYNLKLPKGNMEWEIAEWKDQYNVIRYVDVSENRKNLTHYIWIYGISGGQKLANLSSSLVNQEKERLITSTIREVEAKNWNVGLGWVKQRLGSGIMNQAVITDYISSYGIGNYLAYPYLIADEVYCLMFLFNNQQMLRDIKLAPRPEGNPILTGSMTAIEKQKLFNEYLDKSKNKLPDEEIEYLCKAKQLFPDHPALNNRKVPRFTFYKDLPEKERYQIERIIVDWKNRTTWLVSVKHPILSGDWDDAVKWIDNLQSYRGGGWDIPSKADKIKLGGFPYVFKSAPNNELNICGFESFNNKVLSKVFLSQNHYNDTYDGDGVRYVAIRQLRKGVLPKQPWNYFKTDELLPIKCEE